MLADNTEDDARFRGGVDHFARRLDIRCDRLLNLDVLLGLGADLDGLEAELTYGHKDASTIVADHTFVPPSYRGHGLAEKLVNALIEDARRLGFKIVPLCSYVAAQVRRHPEWADLRA